MVRFVVACMLLIGCDDKKAPSPAPLPWIGSGTFAAASGFSLQKKLVRPSIQSTRDQWMAYAEHELDEIVGDLNTTYKLPRTVTAKLVACGQANAVYIPPEHAILFCEEFVDQFLALFRDAPPKKLEESVAGAIAFFFLHEVGHALIGELELPVFGNEEAAADTYATYLLLSTGESSLALEAADTFARMADDKAAQGLSIPAWDVHGLDEQRFFTVLCLIYGSNARTYQSLIDGVLPPDKAEQCPLEWDRNKQRIESGLAAHHK